MSHPAVEKVSFLGKAPTDRHELRRILDLAGRLMARDARPGRDLSLPDNVIPFPRGRR